MRSYYLIIPLLISYFGFSFMGNSLYAQGQPTITCPSDTLVACIDGLDTTLTGVAVYNFPGVDPQDVILSYIDQQVPGMGNVVDTTYRTWSAMDASGNMVSCVQTLSRFQLTPNSIICPPDTSLDCMASTDTSATGTPDVLFPCADPADIDIDFNDVIVAGTLPAIDTTYRTWSASDASGNVVSCLQTITRVQRDPNTILCPSDLILDCLASTDTSSTGTPVVLFPCADPADINVDYNDVIVAGTLPAIDTTYRTWSASDASGNVVSCLQTITRVQIDPNTIVCPSDLILDCLASTDTSSTGIPQVEFPCANPADVTVSYNDLIVAGDVPAIDTTYRTWSASDASGNVVTCTQTITRIQTVPNSIVCPPDFVLGCNAVTDTTLTGTPEVDFPCADPADISISFNDVITTGDCPAIDTTYRTWSASDASGNVISCVQTITRIDMTPPVLVSTPADVTISCEDAIPMQLPVATDECSDPVVNMTETFTADPDCPDGGVIIREFEICDDCDNCISTQQSITIIDEEKPILTFVHPELLGASNGVVLIYECNSNDPDWGVPNFDSTAVTVTDNCDNEVELEQIEIETIGDCAIDGFFRQIRCSFVATDNCGNIDSAWFFIQIQDTEAPVFANVPSDTTVDCKQDIPEYQVSNCPDTVSGQNIILVNDACECAYVDLVQDTIPGSCPGNYQIQRTWYAVDNCGNEATASQLITVIDTIAPLFYTDLPELNGINSGDTIAAECEGLDLPAWLWMLNASTLVPQDDCSPISGSTHFSHDWINSSHCYESGFLELHHFSWTAMDDCGNESTWYFYFKLIDHTPPTITGVVPVLCASINVEQEVSVDDNCSAPTLNVTEHPGVDSCTGESIIVRRYESQDACGNTSVVEQLILNHVAIPDLIITDPMLSGVSFEDTVYMACEFFVEGLISDESVEVNGGLCPGQSAPVLETTTTFVDCNTYGYASVMEATWSVATVCGDTFSETIFFKLIDTLAPVWADFNPILELRCGEDLPNIEIFDECSGPVNVIDTILSDSCMDMHPTVIRFVELEDGCGNTSSYLQEIRFIGNSVIEIFGLPENDMVCAPFDLNNISAIDHCTGQLVDVIFTEDSLICMDGNGMLRNVTYTVTGSCSITESGRFSIVTDDTSAPQFEIVDSRFADFSSGDTIFVECDLETLDLDSESIISIDNCLIEPTVEFNWHLEASGSCRDHGFMTIWSANWNSTDICGNEADFVLYVMVGDTTAPVFFNVPTDVTVNCTPANLPEVIAIDNCGPVEVSFEESIIMGETGEIIHRIWTAIDDCGNIAKTSQYVHVNDVINVGLTCEMIPPEVVYCNSSGNLLAVEVIGGTAPYKYIWSVVGGVCQIDHGQGTAGISFSIGYSPATIQVEIVDFEGCSTICTYSVNCIYRKSDIAMGIEAQAVDFELLQNKPNPFRDYTTIAFVLSSKQAITLNIFDVKGNSLLTINREAKAGYNEIIIEKGMLDIVKGVLYYQLLSDQNVATKKMLFID